MQTPTERIAASVRAEIARAGRTGSDLARHMGWTQPTASRRLTGQTEFTASEVVAVAAWLGVPTSTLLAEDVAA